MEEDKKLITKECEEGKKRITIECERLQQRHDVLVAKIAAHKIRLEAKEKVLSLSH